MNKKLIFRQAIISSNQPNFNLQDSLIKAIKKHNTVRLRIQETLNNKQYRMINRKAPYKSLYCAELVEYTEGKSQLSASVDLDNEAFDIEAITPAKRNAEFLDGIIYFGVHKNSLVFIKTALL